MPGRKRKAEELQMSRLEEKLGSLSPDELRKELQAVGESAGPIDGSTKEMYVRMLARKKLRLETETTSTTSDISTVSSSLSPTPGRSPSLVGPAAPGLTRKPLIAAGGAESPRGRKMAAKSSAPGSKKAAGKTSTPLSSGARTTGGATVLTAAALGSKKKPKAGSQKDSLQRIRDFEIEGLTAATFTPFDVNGEVNLLIINQYVRWLLSCGVANIFLNGTTGESMSLTVEERKMLVEKWVEAAAGRLNIIVHVGTENLKYTCELAQHAQANGAVAIGVMPTTFFKPATINHLVEYLEKVGEAAPAMPMYYYNIPSMTGVNFSMEEFLEVGGPRLPTLRGLKYTSKDLFEFGRCVVSQAERYQIIYGCDEQVIGALALGGVAAIGSTYNYAGKLYNRLFSAFQRKDTEAAKLEQRRAQAMVKLLFKYGSHPGGGKAFMKLCGIDCGPPRLPFLPLSPENVRRLESDLTDIGFFEWS